MEALENPARSRRILLASSAIGSLCLVAIALVPQTIAGITSTRFLPHVYCYLYDRSLIALHVGADTAIWLSYVSISVTLTYLVYRTRREIPFSWMFLAFGVFIISCGFTHLMEVVVLWKPLYWLSADVKLVTAVASLITAIALPPLVPAVTKMVQAAHVSEHRKQQLEALNQDLSRANEDLEQQVQLRSRAESELRHLSGRLLELQDQERRNLARELHDSTGQVLAALQLNLAVLRDSNPAPELNERFADSIALTDQAIGEVRTMSYLLHPPMLDEAGLGLAIQWFLAGFRDRSNIEVRSEIAGNIGRLPHELELAIFRVLQESLTNVHRHSGSKAAHVRLAIEGNEISLTVSDQGRGIRQDVTIDGDGHGAGLGVGIRGMRERVRQLGGTIGISSDLTGTRVEVRFPAGKAASPVASA